MLSPQVKNTIANSLTDSPKLVGGSEATHIGCTSVPRGALVCTSRQTRDDLEPCRWSSTKRVLDIRGESQERQSLYSSCLLARGSWAQPKSGDS